MGLLHQRRLTYKLTGLIKY